MKKLKYLFLFTLVAGFVGCEAEFVDLEDRDTVPADMVLNTIEGLEATMYQVYQTSRAVHENPATSVYKIAGTDLVKAGTNLQDEAAGGMPAMHSYSNALSPISGQIESLWNAYYTALNRTLRVIQATQVLEPQNDSEIRELELYEGYARTMKAYLYLELVRRWDNIPIATLQEEGTEPSLDAPLQPQQVVYDTIINNLERALPLLPLRNETQSVGTPTKGLANLLLAKAHLDQGNWQEAATAAEAVINDPSYELQSLDYIFGLEGGKDGEESNNEIILSWVFSPDVDNRRQRTSMMLTPLYDRVEGVLRTLETGGRPWARFSPSDYYWTLFDEDDGRLEAWHWLNWRFNDADNLPAGKELGEIVTREDVVEQFGEGSLQLRYIEPTSVKYWEDGTYGRTVGDADGFRNIIVFRYSEAFILAAEAHFRMGNEGQAAEYLNVLRERAFGNSDNNFSSITFEDIIEEQARELGHEGHRWGFLKRNGLLLERARTYNPEAAQFIQEHNVRWPIPQSFVDLAGVQQNPGY